MTHVRPLHSFGDKSMRIYLSAEHQPIAVVTGRGGPVYLSLLVVGVRHSPPVAVQDVIRRTQAYGLAVALYGFFVSLGHEVLVASSVVASTSGTAA